MQGLRATRIPGEGTPWTRMLERFLGEEGPGRGAARADVAPCGGGPALRLLAWVPAPGAAAEPGRQLNAAPAGR